MTHTLTTTAPNWMNVDPLAVNFGLKTQNVRRASLYSLGINNISDANPNFIPQDNALTFEDFYSNWLYGQIRIDRTNITPVTTVSTPTPNFGNIPSSDINYVVPENILVDINREIATPWTHNLNTNVRTGNPSLQIRGAMAKVTSSFASTLSSEVDKVLRAGFARTIGSPTADLFASGETGAIDSALRQLDKDTDTDDITNDRVLVVGDDLLWDYRSTDHIYAQDSTFQPMAMQNTFGTGLGGGVIESARNANFPTPRGIPIYVDKTLNGGFTAGYLQDESKFTARAPTATVNNIGNNMLTISRAATANAAFIPSGSKIYAGTMSSSEYLFTTTEDITLEVNTANDEFTIRVSEPINETNQPTGGAVLHILGNTGDQTTSKANAYRYAYLFDRTSYVAATRLMPATVDSIRMMDAMRAGGYSTIGEMVDSYKMPPGYSLPLPMLGPEGTYAYSLFLQSDRNGLGLQLYLKTLFGVGMVDPKLGVTFITEY